MVSLIHCPSMEMAANVWLRPRLRPQMEVTAKPSHLTQHQQLPIPEPEADKLLEHRNPLVAAAGDNLLLSLICTDHCVGETHSSHNENSC